MALRLLLWKADDTLHLVLLGNQVISMHRTTCWLSSWWLSLGHARLCDPMDCSMSGLSCPSPSPRVCSDSCPLSPWCCAIISSSFILFSSCPQSFQHQGLFQWIFRIDHLYDWLVWFPCSPRDSSRVFSSTTVQRHQFFGAQPSLWSLTSVHDYWKNHCFEYTDLCRQSNIFAF